MVARSSASGPARQLGLPRAKRHAERAPVLCDLLRLAPRVFRISNNIGDLNGFALQQDSSNDPAAPRRKRLGQHVRLDALVAFGGMAVARSPTVGLAFTAEQPGMVRVTQPRC